MADVFTQAKRSEVMARIRSRGNRDTELALARLLRRHGITGWRRHQQIQNSEFGIQNFKVRPDFVFPKQRLAVFVDGCFWHGCPKHSNPKKWLRKSSMPAKPVSTASTRTGRVFWQSKLSANQVRDRKVNRVLRQAGWRVLRIWEHELKKGEVRNTKCERPKVVRRIQRALH